MLNRLWHREPPIEFHDLATRAQGDASDEAGLITLVEPSSRHADRYLADVSHPTCRDDPDCRVDPRRLLASLRQHPGGRERCDERAGCLLAYRFWIHLDAPGHVGFSGRISFRIPAANRPGRRLTRYVGHIGYVVFPQARGRRIAARATRMLLPLARSHGLADLSITCNPENLASRRTIEHIGGELMEVTDVPQDHPLWDVGERRKCRYRVRL